MFHGRSLVFQRISTIYSVSTNNLPRLNILSNLDYLHIDTHTYIYYIYICIYAYIVYIRLLRRAWQRSLRKFDPFEILDVTPQSSASQIKRAYRKLSLNYHPEPWRKAGERLWGDTDLLGPTFCTKSGLMIKKHQMQGRKTIEHWVDKEATWQFPTLATTICLLPSLTYYGWEQPISYPRLSLYIYIRI